MSGPTIASQVAAGLVQAAKATGTGSFSSILRRKNGNVFEYFEISCVQTRKKSFDAAMMVVRTNRVLLVSALGEKPEKGDHVAVGVALANVNDVKNWARVALVTAIEPAGIPLLYRVTMDE